MNFLGAVQLISAVIQVLGKACHPQCSNDGINELKNGLEQISKFFSDKHAEQSAEKEKENKENA